MPHNYIISVELNTYAGNHDSFITGLLFGIDDDRHGAGKGLQLREQLSEEFIAVTDRITEYLVDCHDQHELPYRIDFPNNNFLIFEAEVYDDTNRALIENDFSKLCTFFLDGSFAKILDGNDMKVLSVSVDHIIKTEVVTPIMYIKVNNE